MKQVAEDMGVGDTFTLAPLGIYFGDKPGEAHSDPYFGGVGPARKSCTHCGECMTGCRHGAKNTLPKNYLGLAEKIGAQVYPLTTVTHLEQVDGGKWKISAKKTNGLGKREFFAAQVVMAAGTYNTQKLLHKWRESSLPHISNTLGCLSRTNSEALTGAIMPKVDIDFSQGAAITSSFYPAADTHVEPVRYGKGSNSMGLLQTILSAGWTPKERRRSWMAQLIARPALFFKILDVRKWSQRTVIALVMQNVDSSIKVFRKRGLFGYKLSSHNDSQRPNATYIPAANETVEKIAARYGGIPAGHIGDLIGAPFTAHFVGGCVIGDSQSNGVIDPYHRIYSYPTLHIVDGSTITANLGVNPSLTITAQAERAFAMWPNKNEIDPRPAQNAGYQRISAIAPIAPAVPRGAIGELRIVEVK
jgi:cholesterol oxidase